MVELIDFFVAADKAANALHVGMHHHRTEEVGVHRVKRELDQLHIAEALKAVGRLEDILPAAAHKNVFVAGRAVVAGVKIAVTVQHLGMVQHHTGAPGGTDAQLHVSGHVLAKVQHPLALWRADDLHRRQTLLLGNPFALLRDQPGADVRAHRLAKEGYRGGFVHGLAVVNFGGCDLGGVHVPALVGAQQRGAAVGVGHLQPANQRGVVGKIVIDVPVADIADRPALPQPDFNAGRTGQQLGYIVALHLYAMAVAGPARRQHPFADTPAVDVQRVNAHGRHLKHRPPHRLCGAELLPEADGRLALVNGRGDPDSVLLHNPWSPLFSVFRPAGLAPGRSAAAADRPAVCPQYIRFAGGCQEEGTNRLKITREKQKETGASHRGF